MFGPRVVCWENWPISHETSVEEGPGGLRAVHHKSPHPGGKTAQGMTDTKGFSPTQRHVSKHRS